MNLPKEKSRLSSLSTCSHLVTMFFMLTFLTIYHCRRQLLFRVMLCDGFLWEPSLGTWMTTWCSDFTIFTQFPSFNSISFFTELDVLQLCNEFEASHLLTIDPNVSNVLHISGDILCYSYYPLLLISTIITRNAQTLGLKFSEALLLGSKLVESIFLHVPLSQQPQQQLFPSRNTLVSQEFLVVWCLVILIGVPQLPSHTVLWRFGLCFSPERLSIKVSQTI